MKNKPLKNKQLDCNFGFRISYFDFAFGDFWKNSCVSKGDTLLDKICSKAKRVKFFLT